MVSLKFGPKWEKSGTFSDHISVHFDLKKPKISPKWSQSDPRDKSDIPIRIPRDSIDGSSPECPPATSRPDSGLSVSPGWRESIRAVTLSDVSGGSTRSMTRWLRPHLAVHGCQTLAIIRTITSKLHRNYIETRSNLLCCSSSLKYIYHLVSRI